MQTYPELMAVFAAHHALSSRVCPIVSSCSDVDEQPGRCVDPASINLVQGVGLVSIREMRVDIEHIVSPLGISWCFIIED